MRAVDVPKKRAFQVVGAFIGRFVERDLEDALFALFAQRAHQSTQLELLLVAEMKFLEYHDTARNQPAADFLRHSRRQQAVDIGADLVTAMVAQQRYLQSNGESPLDVRRTAISIFCARQRSPFR